MNKLITKKYRTRNNALIISLFLSSLLVFISSIRPKDFGHDTALYIEVFNNYRYDKNDLPFPDITFHSLATVCSNFFNQLNLDIDSISRIFLLIVALFQGYLLSRILILKKYPIESIVFAVGFGPLIFFDIIRQGTAMLLTGVFLSSQKKHYYYIIAAVATHSVAIVSFLNLAISKLNRFRLILMILSCLAISILVISDLELRLNYYLRTEGYLSAYDLSIEVLGISKFSLMNLAVLFFFLYGYCVGGITKAESFILSFLYLASIFLPLLYRLYLFYFFSISCSRDMLLTGNKFKLLLFNILYIIIVLRFSINAFNYFD